MLTLNFEMCKNLQSKLLSILVIFATCVHSFLWAHEEDGQTWESTALKKRERTCDLLLQYQGRQHKLFPVAREFGLPSQAIYTALWSVPEARYSLEAIQRNNKRIKVHSFLATLGVFTLVGNHFIRKIGDESYTSTHMGIDLGAALLFLQGIFFNKYLQRKNRKEIELAIKRFNSKNEEKIILMGEKEI